MKDLYLIENSTVLKNLLGITDEKELDLAEAELSRANMMLLYENGFDDFSSGGFCYIHKFLFGDVYERAGEYRKINIQKRETLLAGQSTSILNNDIVDIISALCYHYQNEVISMIRNFTKLYTQPQPCHQVWAYSDCVHLR